MRRKSFKTFGIQLLNSLLSLFVFILAFSCKTEPIETPFSLFGNVYRIDSISGKEGFADPFFIVLTKDSLFNAFGYWDYSFPYETELRINDSLQVIKQNSKYAIEPVENGFWINFQNGKKHLYSIAPGKYDSAFKHLRIINTQESLLIGSWKPTMDKMETKSILRCSFSDSSILEFTRLNNHKIALLKNYNNTKIDTCFRRSVRLDGNSILINDDDTFPPFKILRLNDEQLILQDYKNVLQFKKIK